MWVGDFAISWNVYNGWDVSRGDFACADSVANIFSACWFQMHLYLILILMCVMDTIRSCQCQTRIVPGQATTEVTPRLRDRKNPACGQLHPSEWRFSAGLTAICGAGCTMPQARRRQTRLR